MVLKTPTINSKMSETTPTTQAPQKSSQSRLNGDFESDPNYELIRNNNYTSCWIYAILSLILGIFGMILAFMCLGNPQINFMFVFGISSMACGLGLFMYLSVIIPSYGAGKPSALKILPLALGTLIYIGCMIKSFMDKDMGWIDLAIRVSVACIFCVILYFGHLTHDDSGSFWINCKPWIYKLKQNELTSV